VIEVKICQKEHINRLKIYLEIEEDKIKIQENNKNTVMKIQIY